MRQRMDAVSQTNWIVVRNVEEGEAIPPFAVMAVLGVDDDGAVQVGLPTRDGQTDILVNGFAVIPRGGKGQATRDLPMTVLYDPSTGTPAVGEIWGVEAGSWHLCRYKPGFKIMGGISEAGPVVTITAMDAVLATVIEITSTTTEDGLYPAREMIYDVITGDYAEGEACWYKDVNDL